MLFQKQIHIPNILIKHHVPVKGDLYVNPSGSVDVNGTWEKNINYNINPQLVKKMQKIINIMMNIKDGLLMQLEKQIHTYYHFYFLKLM